MSELTARFRDVVTSALMGEPHTAVAGGDGGGGSIALPVKQLINIVLQYAIRERRVKTLAGSAAAQFGRREGADAFFQNPRHCALWHPPRPGIMILTQMPDVFGQTAPIAAAAATPIPAAAAVGPPHSVATTASAASASAAAATPNSITDVAAAAVAATDLMSNAALPVVATAAVAVAATAAPTTIAVSAVAAPDSSATPLAVAVAAAVPTDLMSTASVAFPATTVVADAIPIASASGMLSAVAAAPAVAAVAPAASSVVTARKTKRRKFYPELESDPVLLFTDSRNARICTLNLDTSDGADEVVERFHFPTLNRNRDGRPFGIAIDHTDNSILVSDPIAHNVRRIRTTDSYSWLIAGSTIGESGFVDGNGTAAKLNSPRGLTVSSDSTFVIVADYNNHYLRCVRLQPDVDAPVSTVRTTYAGWDGMRSPPPPLIHCPRATAWEKSGDPQQPKDSVLFIACYHMICRYDVASTHITKWLTDFQALNLLSVAPNILIASTFNGVYTIDTTTGRLNPTPLAGGARFYSSDDGDCEYAGFNDPTGLAIDDRPGSGGMDRLYVIDACNHSVRAVTGTLF